MSDYNMFQLVATCQSATCSSSRQHVSLQSAPTNGNMAGCIMLNSGQHVSLQHAPAVGNMSGSNILNRRQNLSGCNMLNRNQHVSMQHA
jgi:hypothetical protein